MDYSRKSHQKKSYETIVILRALQLGDLLCAIPAFRSLRAAYPLARVSLVGLPWAIEFVNRFHRYLDEWIEFPGYPGLPERNTELSQIPAFITSIQARHFDLALQMQGSGNITNPLVALFGAETTGGYFLPEQYCPDQDHFLSYPLRGSEVERHLQLMEFLGIDRQGSYLEFPLDHQDLLSAETLEQQYQLIPGKYICIHPGARSLDRRWPTKRFALVADALASDGYSILLTGSADEEDVAIAVSEQMSFPAVNLSGKTGLGTLAAILSRARLLISNDTGVSHLASALQVPSVVLFLASDPDRWAPLDRELHRVIVGATAVSPENVLVAAKELLEKDWEYVSR